MWTAISSLPFLWQGLLMTLQVSFLVVVISLVIGVVMGIGLIYGPRWLYWPIRAYSDLIRGIPVLVLIFFVYYGLPPLGLNLDTFWAAVAALTLAASRSLRRRARKLRHSRVLPLTPERIVVPGIHSQPPDQGR